MSLQLPHYLGPEGSFGLQRMVCPCFSIRFLLHLPFQYTLCGPSYRTRPTRPHHPRGSVPDSAGGYQLAIKPGISTYWSYRCIYLPTNSFPDPFTRISQRETGAPADQRERKYSQNISHFPPALFSPRLFPLQCHPPLPPLLFMLVLHTNQLPESCHNIFVTGNSFRNVS